MTIQPIREKLVVKAHSAEETSSGGILLPDNAKEKSSKGEVITVGSGWITKEGAIVPLEIAPGDTVIFAKGAGNPVTVGKDEYTILSEDEILAIIEQGE